MIEDTGILKPVDIGNGKITVHVKDSIVTGLAFYSPNSPTQWAKATYVNPISPDIWKMTEQERQPLVREQRHRHAEVSDHLAGLEGLTGNYEGVEVKQEVVVPQGIDGYVQLYKIRNNGETPVNVPASFVYNLGLRPASTTPLTSGHPVDMPGNVYKARSADGMLVLYAQGIDTYVATSLRDETNTQDLELRLDAQQSDEPIKYIVPINIELNPGEQKTLAVYTSLDQAETGAKKAILGLKEKGLESILEEDKFFWDGIKVEKDFAHNFDWNWVINSNLRFNLGSCAVQREDGGYVLITDPQILPLTWNRDNYYQARLFLSAYHENRSPELRKVLFSYMKGLFDMQKPEGGWGRDHYVDGRVKDDIFQFDQNSYPILLLSEIDRELEDKTPEEQEIISNIVENKLESVVNVLMSKKNENAALFETDETPADNPTEHKYHLSTNVLAWKASTELARLKQKYGFQHSGDFASLNEHIRQDVYRFFATKIDNVDIFFYETDLVGNGRFYFDANDLAFSLAPEWGFTGIDDVLWQNTLNFAFSPENESGYFSGGRYEGLGSVHTKSVWPLGFANEMAIAIQQEDKPRLEKVLKILSEIVQVDGIYSETVYVDTGKVHARPWFAWPGAVISDFLIRHNERINEILSG